eukprot:Em0009g454a
MNKERAATAERRATVAEERAVRAEETASVTIKTATCAEERSIAAEKRAVTAEERKMASDSRATFVAEKECAITKQKCSEALKLTATADERARTVERRATIADERSSIANENAKTTEKRAVIAEARATLAETRASVAEERIKVAEMKTIAAEKKATNATTMVATLEERTMKAEDAVKMLQTDARMSDNRIAEHVQTNTALEGWATRAELQIRDLTAQCQHLQEQLDKANAPSWVLKKDDIVFTDKELGRGGWGVVKAAREMNIAALMRHPNILLFIGATLGQECVILTELMQTSLRAVLEEKEINKLSMSRQEVSNIAMDVGKALNYLHLMKPDAIIHRDVSSANVLLELVGTDVWKAKLSDVSSSNFAHLDVPRTESASSSSVAHVVPGSEVGSRKRLKEEVMPLVSSRQLRVLKHRGLGILTTCPFVPGGTGPAYPSASSVLSQASVATTISEFIRQLIPLYLAKCGSLIKFHPSTNSC